MTTPIKKVLVFGLDCAEPSLMLDRWLTHLPNVRQLMQNGAYGKLTSCLPPITVPAWSCMTASKDPGTLGIYGFRNRKDYSYDGLSIATSLAVRENRIWDILSDQNKNSVIVGVPGTYPITKPPRGAMISCFLTPDIKSEYTYPKELKQTIADLVGEYMVDVKDFRTDNKAWLLEQIYQMTDRRFAVVNMLLESQPWDLLWMVEMGHDRIHHGFWQFMDPQHHRYAPGNPFENAILDYYIHTDRLIGQTLSRVDLNTTAVWIVSDHGAKCMTGGFCFNDWLIREGYLVMKRQGDVVRKFKFEEVDWSRTRVWGEGGYYGRCFLNVRGREPQGIVAPEDYESLRSELQRKLQSLKDPSGQTMKNVAHKPQDIYQKINGVAPDLIVIFGDLHWRSVGSIGHESLYAFENDTGPDDANHAQDGLFICSHPSLSNRGLMTGATLYDVTPSMLKLMGLSIPSDMRGQSLF